MTFWQLKELLDCPFKRYFLVNFCFQLLAVLGVGLSIYTGSLVCMWVWLESLYFFQREQGPKHVWTRLHIHSGRAVQSWTGYKQICFWADVVGSVCPTGIQRGVVIARWTCTPILAVQLSLTSVILKPPSVWPGLWWRGRRRVGGKSCTNPCWELVCSKVAIMLANSLGFVHSAGSGKSWQEALTECKIFSIWPMCQLLLVAQFKKWPVAVRCRMLKQDLTGLTTYWLASTLIKYT